MPIVGGDIIKHVCEFVLPGAGIQQNKFTWEYDGSEISDANFMSGMSGWAEDFYELAAAAMPSGIDTLTSYFDLMEYDDVKKIWATSRNIGVAVGNVTFTNATDPLPPQCCPCLVGFTGRPKTRGRKFLPLWCEDTQASGGVVAGFQDELAAILAEYLLDFVLGTGMHVTPGVTSDKYGDFLPFLSGLVKSVIFTQRRRTVGRGA